MVGSKVGEDLVERKVLLKVEKKKRIQELRVVCPYDLLEADPEIQVLTRSGQRGVEEWTRRQSYRKLSRDAEHDQLLLPHACIRSL